MTAGEKADLASLERGHHRKDHPAWFDCFSEEQRGEMLSDDLSAGRSVPALLTAIISAGVVLALVSVLLIS